MTRDHVVVRAAGPLSGEVRAPGSKSVTNRLLVLAALAAGESRLRGALDSDDTRAMRDLVGALGASVRDDGADWVVEGTGGRLQVPLKPLECRLSGTTMRFGTALAALAPGPVTVDGLPPLRRRTIGALTQALRTLGANVADDAGYPPVALGGGGFAGGAVTVDVSGSSQFASAVLLVAPYADRAVTVRTHGAAALGYVEMTARAMAEWGVEPRRLDDGWVVAPGPYRARVVVVAADASAAAHLYALAAATGGRVTVTNAGSGDDQPDVAVLDVLEAFGADVQRDGDAVTVTGPQRLRAVPGGIDVSAFPDQVTTVAALAALADGTTLITGAEVVRGHETDRLHALAVELAKVGIRVEEHPGGLTVHGGSARGPAVLQTHDDHRLAMAFAALAARVGDVAVADPRCVAKTYPGFWDDLASLGGILEHGHAGPVIAIDGPAGSGKSTVARAVAERLGVPHVDTGAYYRAAALAVLRAGVDPGSPQAADVARSVRISRPAGRTLLDGEDVEDEIRGARVTAAVSAVAANTAVRAALLEAQRSGVGLDGAVVEGRDAGTVVVPDATLKIWLDADPAERGRRRAAQLGADRAAADHTSELARRDAADAAQMSQAPDVVTVDTTGLTVDQVVEAVLALSSTRRAR